MHVRVACAVCVLQHQVSYKYENNVDVVKKHPNTKNQLRNVVVLRGSSRVTSPAPISLTLSCPSAAKIT
jgi:hypothetical protein